MKSTKLFLSLILLGQMPISPDSSLMNFAQEYPVTTVFLAAGCTFGAYKMYKAIQWELTVGKAPWYIYNNAHKIYQQVKSENATALKNVKELKECTKENYLSYKTKLQDQLLEDLPKDTIYPFVAFNNKIEKTKQDLTWQLKILEYKLRYLDDKELISDFTMLIGDIETLMDDLDGLENFIVKSDQYRYEHMRILANRPPIHTHTTYVVYRPS